MSKFTLSNQIFNLGLDSKELSVYAYLCSLPSFQNTLSGAATVRVKQATIALKCGIKAVQTVSKGNTAQLPNEQKYDIIDIWKDK